MENNFVEKKINDFLVLESRKKNKVILKKHY